MQKYPTLAVLFLLPLMLYSGNVLSNKQNITLPDDVKHAYVGVETCGMCHKSAQQGEQLNIWKKSAHALAYLALQTPKADSIALTKGFTTKAAETEACLKCHVSGYNIDKELVKAKFKMEDGVQCETCHGAGNDYKSPSIMKDKEKAVANGLIVPADREAFCKGCHNTESPTFISFNFADQWAKIKHYKPGNEK